MAHNTPFVLPFKCVNNRGLSCDNNPLYDSQITLTVLLFISNMMTELHKGTFTAMKRKELHKIGGLYRLKDKKSPS